PSSLKSFRPDGLCAEIPLLRSLLDGRLVLDRLRDGSITVDHARSELDRLWGGSPLVSEILGLLPSESAAKAPAKAAAAPAARWPEGGSDVDALLAMVDLGGGAPEGAAPEGAAPEGAAPPAEAADSAGRGAERAPSASSARFSELISNVVASA